MYQRQKMQHKVCCAFAFFLFNFAALLLCYFSPYRSWSKFFIFIVLPYLCRLFFCLSPAALSLCFVSFISLLIVTVKDRHQLSFCFFLKLVSFKLLLLIVNCLFCISISCLIDSTVDVATWLCRAVILFKFLTCIFISVVRSAHWDHLFYYAGILLLPMPVVSSIDCSMISCINSFIIF